MIPWLVFCALVGYIAYHVGRAGGAFYGYRRGWKEGTETREIRELEELLKR